VSLDELATTGLPLADAPAAYEMLQRQADGAVNIMLKPSRHPVMIISHQSRNCCLPSKPLGTRGLFRNRSELENVVTSPTYDPTGRPVEPGPEQYDAAQPDPRLGEPGEPGTFAESELEYASTEGARDYGEPVDSGMGSSSTVDTAKDEAANVKDTAVDAAAGVKDVAKGEASNAAQEAKYQARSLVDQTRSQLRGQANNQQSALAEELHGWASELGSMASRSDESGPMSDFAQQASRRVDEISHWLDNHEPADLLNEVKRFARRRPVAFLAIAAAAGVLAGRMTRGAVAANTNVDSDRESAPARAYDSGAYDYETATPSGAMHGTGGYQDGDYAPRYGDTGVPTTAGYQGAGTGPTGTLPDTGMTTPGQYPTEGTVVPEQPGATGTAYPDMTPTTDETYYPPPVEGEVRR
jgi:hypothetical protein